jgi:hypothetical protein
MFREERLQSRGNLIVGGMLCGQTSMFIGEEILKIKNVLKILSEFQVISIQNEFRNSY